MKINLFDFSLLGRDSKLKAFGLTADNVVRMVELDEPVGYPDSFISKEQEQTRESDDYDYKTCHQQ